MIEKEIRESLQCRMFLLGNSFVFGHGVNYDETFGHVMEEKLGIKVLNTGMNGYDTSPDYS